MGNFGRPNPKSSIESWAAEIPSWKILVERYFSVKRRKLVTINWMYRRATGATFRAVGDSKLHLGTGLNPSDCPCFLVEQRCSWKDEVCYPRAFILSWHESPYSWIDWNVMIVVVVVVVVVEQKSIKNERHKCERRGKFLTLFAVSFPKFS